MQNPTNQYWLIKVNNRVDGRGILRLKIDSTTLECYDWIQREVLKFKEQWKHPWAHETVVNTLYRVLPDVIKNSAICQKNDLIKKQQVYTSYASFEKDMNTYGCLLEMEAAYADQQEVTAITVDCFVTPGCSEHQIIISGDQIHAGNHLQFWGSTVPQCSIDDLILKAEVDKILNHLVEKENFFGNISIDFATFFDDQDQQNLWAIDFKFGISNQLAMYRIGEKLSNRTPEEMKDIHMALCPHMIHTNLSCVHYCVLFQMLKAYAVGWNAQKKTGTILALMDVLARENLGVISVSNISLAGALKGLARAMAVINKEISSPNMQGETNFHAAIDEIDTILTNLVGEEDQ